MWKKPSGYQKKIVRFVLVILLVGIGAGASAITRLHPDFTGYATAVDYCDPDPALAYHDTTEPDVCGVTVIRTWQATDSCGNTAESVQRIRITDTTPPVLRVPQDKTVDCDSPTTPVYTGYARAEDSCDPNPTVTYIDDVQVKTCGSVIVRVWIARDSCGNTARCVQKIKLADNEPPSLRCPPDATISCDGSSDPFYTGYPLVMDNCDLNPTVTYRDTVGLRGCHGYITRTWQATDACGNTRFCMQRIKVVAATASTYEGNPWINDCPALPDDIPDCDCY